MFQCDNLPDKLKPLINRWNQSGKEYCLNPDNLFYYNGHKIAYHGGVDIPLSGWFASNGDVKYGYSLTKSDVEEIEQELLRHYRPDEWTLILDWHCNYRCPMCPYHGDGMADKERYFEDRGGRKKVVPKETAYERIDQLIKYGVKRLSIMSDGEILLYPYWRDVSQYAHEKGGMDLWTITNGSLWTEETVKEAVSFGYTNIRVSLDALSFKTYAKIRSTSMDYYEKAMQLPELLLKYGIHTNVHFVKQKENMHEVQPFIDYWKEKKVDSISIANQFYYDGEIVVNKFAESEKEYLDGLCTAFGNMQTLPTGDTVCCCGRDPILQEKNHLEIIGCQKSVEEAIEEMRTENSKLRAQCRKCALYVPYSDEKIVDGWKILRNSERETWIRMAE